MGPNRNEVRRKEAIEQERKQGRERTKVEVKYLQKQRFLVCLQSFFFFLPIDLVGKEARILPSTVAVCEGSRKVKVGGHGVGVVDDGGSLLRHRAFLYRCNLLRILFRYFNTCKLLRIAD